MLTTGGTTNNASWIDSGTLLFSVDSSPFSSNGAWLIIHILSVGGLREADELYTEFRGRLPGVEALLKGRGLDKVA